jgi:uncharacterized protein HemX
MTSQTSTVATEASAIESQAPTDSKDATATDDKIGSESFWSETTIALVACGVVGLLLIIALVIGLVTRCQRQGRSKHAAEPIELQSKQASENARHAAEPIELQSKQASENASTASEQTVSAASSSLGGTQYQSFRVSDPASGYVQTAADFRVVDTTPTYSKLDAEPHYASTAAQFRVPDEPHYSKM